MKNLARLRTFSAREGGRARHVQNAIVCLSPRLNHGRPVAKSLRYLPARCLHCYSLAYASQRASAYVGACGKLACLRGRPAMGWPLEAIFGGSRLAAAKSGPRADHAALLRKSPVRRRNRVGPRRLATCYSALSNHCPRCLMRVSTM
jgi:hypothetical protein